MTNSQSFISREQMQHLHNYNFWWRKRPRFTVSLKAFANMRLIAATDISKIYIGEHGDDMTQLASTATESYTSWFC